MTLGVVLMLGAGILLIVSAIENASIITTFLAIWKGQPISSLATQASLADTTNEPPAPTTKKK